MQISGFWPGVPDLPFQIQALNQKLGFEGKGIQVQISEFLAESQILYVQTNTLSQKLSFEG